MINQLKYENMMLCIITNIKHLSSTYEH